MDYRFGALLGPGTTTFRLWAPGVHEAEVIFPDRDPVPMTRKEQGFLEASAVCPAGIAYKYRLDGRDVPDPASRQQQGDSQGWSIVVAPITTPPLADPISPWQEAILCEVHVGTATPEGTFRALADRLEHFRDAGYTTLEIMPINTFPGNRNWGYDGTLIFAPASAYGTRQDLRALVDRAHELGLCLVLDVVYNHFGEVDNFIKDYAPEWFDDEVETPWGPGIDFTEPVVRRFYYENACMWVGEFDFDGLRFDSVHEMKTDAREKFLGELAQAIRTIKPHAKLIIENMNNIAGWLERNDRNVPMTYTAQWNDDIHHVLNFLVTGEPKQGYDDPTKDAIADLEKALADGFVHDGEAGSDSDGQSRDEPASRLPPDAFVSFVQNHDQIGNRADSKRLPDRISARKLDFLHFVLMVAPQIPLYFMGEEAHLRSPFPFFFDLDPETATEKEANRYYQLRHLFEEEVADGGLPDPNDPATFHSAKLPWDDFGKQQYREALDRFRQLAGFRRDLLWPLASTPCLDSHSARKGNALIVNWVFEAGTLTMALNPTDFPTDIDCLITAAPSASGEFSQHGQVLRLDAWSAVAWSSRQSG